MSNKKILQEIKKNLNKAKAPAKKADIDYVSKMGYRDDSPFNKRKSITINTPDGSIDMSNTGKPLLANGKYLPPYSGVHQFNTNKVTEEPLEQAKKGGSRKYSKSLLAKNRLFVKNKLFKKKNYKNKIYDPSAMYFEDGGESGCPDGFYNDPVQGCIPIDDPNKFYENWFQNRVMPTPEGQKLLDKIRPEALERSRESVPYIFDENLGPNDAGYYDVDTRQIMLNKFLPEAQIQATKYHERMHDIQAGDKFTSALEKPQGYLVEQNIIEPKAINTGNPEWDKNLKKNYEDIVDPNEIHARVMTLRRLAGFRPDQTISEKDLQNYFKAVKDSGDKLDPDIEDLKGVTKGTKSIVNLLNDMVSVPGQTEDLMYAQKGGQFGCPIGYEWNGIECIPNPFETRPSQRAAVYMDKDGNYQIDPAYQQYSQQKFDVSESNRKAQEFNKLYAQSKNYKKLLKKQGYTPEEIKDRINSVMNINDFRYIDEGPSWVSANEDTGNEFISYNVTDHGDWPGFDQIAAHEWGHVGVDSGANPLKPKEREEFINRINKEQAGVTGNPDDLIHDMEPQENRADLLQLRQQLQEAGVFDSTKRKKFTKKDLNKYKKIMESSERSWDNMWNRMFRLYDDDSIIYFMNNVAKNNSDDDLQVAKYGLELDLTEDEIKKYVNGGYVVEDISVPSLTRMDEGGEKRKKRKSKEKNVEVIDSTEQPITPENIEQVIEKPEVEVNPAQERVPLMMQFSNEFQENNPYDAYYEKAAYDYLKSKKGWNEALGINKSNLPENVAKRIQNNYYKDLQAYVVNKSKSTQKDYMGKFDKKGNWKPLMGKNNTLDPLSKRPTGHGSWDNYGDGSIQMVYPEQLFMGPGAGILGLAGRAAAKGISNLAKSSLIQGTKAALSQPIANIPGATIGNVIASGFAADAAVNRLPEIPSQIAEGNYLGALENTATGVLDLAGANMISPMISPLIKSIGKGVAMAPEAISNLGKFIGTEEGLLSNAYKLNPWAFKPNPEAGYRMIGGKEGYLDAIASGEIRPTGAYEFAHFNIGQPLNPNRLSAEELIQAGSPGGYKGPYMAEMKDGSWQRMTDAFSNNPEIQEQLKLLGKDKDVWQHPLFGNIKVEDPRLKLYKQDWLKGYKEVPKELPGSPNTSITDRLKQFFDRPPGPLMIGLGSGAKFTREVPNPDYFLDVMKLNKYSPTQKKYFESLIQTVKNQGNKASELQFEELQRIKTGDYNYGKRGIPYEALTVQKETPVFKSEIDWVDWVKKNNKNYDAEDIQNVIKNSEEYNIIEQQTKANGTWMKNADGTPFQGTPEQFIQQQSTKFKQAYPEGTEITYRGGDKRDALTSDWDSKSNVVFTTKDEYGARAYNKSLDQPPLVLTEAPPEGISQLYMPKTTNKIVIDGNEYPVGHKYRSHGFPYINDAGKEVYSSGSRTNYARLNAIDQVPANELEAKNLEAFKTWMLENRPTMTERGWSGEPRILNDWVMTDHFAGFLNSPAARDIDRVEFQKIIDGTLEPIDVEVHNLNKAQQLKSMWGNSGEFDLTNPNKFKALLPYLIPTGLGVGAASQMQGQESNEGYKEGGIVSNLTKKEIDKLIKQGYIIEEID